MRTTLDLPDDLLRRAKVEAIHRGQTLRELVADALRRSLDAPIVAEGADGAPAFLRFPLFDSVEPGALSISQSELDRAEVDEDLRRGAGIGRGAPNRKARRAVPR